MTHTGFPLRVKRTAIMHNVQPLRKKLIVQNTPFFPFGLFGVVQQAFQGHSFSH